MRILLDQGLPRTAAELLRQSGLDAAHVGEIGMSKTKDELILVEARRTNSFIVTLDSDFHRLIAIAQAKSPSVIRIRMQHMTPARVIAILLPILSQRATELAEGVLITVTSDRTRLRHLPIVSRRRRSDGL